MNMTPHRRRCRGIRRLLVVAFWISVTPSWASSQFPDDSTHLVEVLGYTTRVLTLGLDEREPSEPVIVLQSGAGTALEGWGAWPLELAKMAAVVGYDRPGLGDSLFDGVDPTPERVAVHAHELLNVLDIDPPYVLVGHSWGGPLILYFAAQYPDEIAGMVYIDPQDPRISRAEMLLTEDAAEMDRRDAAYRAAVAALRGSGPVAPVLEAEGRVQARFYITAPEQRQVPDDLSVPTAVLLTTRTPSLVGAPYYVTADWFREYHRVRVGRFMDWALGRLEASLLVTTDAGHFVHLDEPDLATAGVARVLGQLR